MVANHGQSKKYIHNIIGCNSRLDSLQAAILDVKLKYLDKYAESRNLVADYYDKHLSSIPDIQIPFRAEYSTCLLYTSPSPRDLSTSRMPSSA